MCYTPWKNNTTFVETYLRDSSDVKHFKVNKSVCTGILERWILLNIRNLTKMV